MKLNYKLIAGAAAALSLALAGAVYAQPGGGMWGMGSGMGMGMGGGMGPGMGMGGGMGPGMGHMGYGMGAWMGSADMASVATARAAELKARLGITPAQETAWKAFETALVQQANTMQAMRTQMHAQTPNQASPGSADWIAQRDALIKQHDASWAAHSAALKDLYAVLTPDQRALLDRGAMGMGGPRAGRPFGPR